MAIPFLNNITLNNNEIQNVRLQNAGSPPLNFGPGQIYFDSTQSPAIVDTAKYYANSTDTWVSLKEYSFPTVAKADGYITSIVTGTTAKPIVKFNLNATGTADSTTYLRGDNQWEAISAIPGTYEFTLSDNANPAVSGVVAESDTVTIAANSDLTSNLTGQASASKTLTVGLKVDGGLGVSNNYVLNQNTGVAAADDTIPFNNFTDNANPALITNIVNKTSFGTIPVTALTLVKNYIDESVTGLLQFIGGFDASTGDLDSPLTTNLYTNTTLAVGDLYVVSTAGNFFGNAATPLTPGDSVIVQTAAAAGTAVEADFIVVQSDTDLATLTTVGIGNVNASTLDNELGIEVAYAAGTAKVGLDIDGLTLDTLSLSPSDYFLPIYDSGSGINNKAKLSELLAFANSVTSFSGTIGDGSSASIRLEDSGAVAPNINHGLGTDSSSFMIQLVDVSSGETVYADVTRGPGGQVTIDFATAPAVNDIRVLIQKIG